MLIHRKTLIESISLIGERTEHLAIEFPASDGEWIGDVEKLEDYLMGEYGMILLGEGEEDVAVELRRDTHCVILIGDVKSQTRSKCAYMYSAHHETAMEARAWLAKEAKKLGLNPEEVLVNGIIARAGDLFAGDAGEEDYSK